MIVSVSLIASSALRGCLFFLSAFVRVFCSALFVYAVLLGLGFDCRVVLVWVVCVWSCMHGQVWMFFLFLILMG